MNYLQAVAHLQRRGNEVEKIHLGLQRISAVMQSLNHPQARYPSLHIAGTNGKGSVAAMSESILRQAGWKCGLYTSPHLLTIGERIRVGGRQISPRRFADVATRIRQCERSLLRNHALDRRLTYFEFVTACAFLHFAEQAIDVAVIEVGLGGRLDATNIVSSRVCVITGVSHDHQDFLGKTLAKIAAEKAGIIKPGVPVISGCQPQEARRVVRRTARSADAPLVEVDRDCRIRITRERRGRFTIDLKTPCRLYRGLHLSMAGEHQTRNAALAVAAVESLVDFPAQMADIRRGLAEVRWPGRLDEYRARRRTLLEGAHNPEGAGVLAAYLKMRREQEIHLVFGVLGDKDYIKMGRLLFPLVKNIHLAPVASLRTADPTSVAAAHPGYRSRIQIHRNSREALRKAWAECSPAGLVVVTGSLYLVAELLPLVRKATKAV